MPVTIRDVAKAAGVSITTVSRALNGYTDVKPQTKAKILDIARRMNYRPSQVARSLVMNKTQTVGLLVSDFNRDRGGHFLLEVLTGVHDSLASRGYDIHLVSTTTAQQRLVSYLDFCTERRFEGVIVMGMRLDDPYVHEVVDATLPSVSIDVPLLSQHCGYVMTDNVNGAKFAVRHLVARGHTKIGFVNGHRKAAVSVDRERGYEDGLRAAGLPVNRDLMYETDFSMEGGASALRQLVAKGVTAVFFASDLMAIGGLRAAQAMGLHVPRDLAIVGYDNIDLTEFVTPSLTTIAQRKYEMGWSAAAMLLDMLSGTGAPEGRMLSPELIVREST